MDYHRVILSLRIIGDDGIYVSSLADLGIDDEGIKFVGDLNQIKRALNIDGGTGTQRFVVSDAGAILGDENVSILGR